jgi:hypothetical protein
VTTFPRFLRIKTSHIDSSRPAGSRQQLTFQSLTTRVSSLGCFSFSGACPTTTSGSLLAPARKRQTPSTGGRSSAGQRNPRTPRCFGSSRHPCLRSHRRSCSPSSLFFPSLRILRGLDASTLLSRIIRIPSTIVYIYMQKNRRPSLSLHFVYLGFLSSRIVSTLYFLRKYYYLALPAYE